MFCQIIQSAINSGRLKFAHAQNWSASASSCNNENIGETEDSNSLNNEKDIVHELQVENIFEDDELGNSSRGTGGPTSFSQSEQQPVTPIALEKQG